MNTTLNPEGTTLEKSLSNPQRSLPAPWAPPFQPIVRTETRGAIIAAPMSFVGSAQRMWRIVPLELPVARRIMLLSLTAVAIGTVWTVVAAWYMTFGLLVVPYRLVRRGQRKRKVEAQRHAELLAAVQIGGRR